MRRYPLADLKRVARTSSRQVMKRGNLSGREYGRYRDEGMSPLVASRLANLFGFHPCEVWPTWFDDAEEDRLRLVRERRNKAMRKWRRKPEVRARMNEANRRYQQETAEYHRSRARARYWADPDAHRAARRERYQRTGK